MPFAGSAPSRERALLLDVLKRSHHEVRREPHAGRVVFGQYPVPGGILDGRLSCGQSTCCSGVTTKSSGILIPGLRAGPYSPRLNAGPRP
jgi:hypothetical protein